MTHLHKRLVFWAALSFLSAGGVHLSYSADCLDPSPTLVAGQNPYGPIEVRDLTPKEYEDIKALLKSLAGDWQGTAEEYECKHHKDPNKMKIHNFTVKARVKVDYYGNFVLWADFYSARIKSSHKEVFRLYLNEKWLRSNSASGFGNVELMQVSPDTIEFFFRRVLPTGADRSSTRKEYFLFLNARDNAFTLKRRVYTQGRLSSKRMWHFSRQ